MYEKYRHLEFNEVVQTKRKEKIFDNTMTLSSTYIISYDQIRGVDIQDNYTVTPLFSEVSS